MIRTIGVTFSLMCVFSLPALAHDGELLKPHDLWTAWAFEPGVLVPLAFFGGLYARGARRCRLRKTSETVAYAGGWTALVIALVSPIHRLGETLFAVHMVQHGILILIAAPLLVLGRPLLPFLFALPMSWRSELGRLAKSNGFQAGWATVTTPYAAWALQGAALWLWHLPVLYQRTVENDFVHAAQHTSFLLSGLLFWWVIFRNAHDASSCGIGAVAVFTTALHTSILGALLTVSGSLWYPIYALRTAPWGLTPLEDQQLAGLIMWVPCGVVYLVAGLVLVFQWINKSESRVTSISTL